MAEKAGWVKLHRKILDNPYLSKNAETIGFFATLLLLASHKEKEFMFNGEMRTLLPGQFITSRSKLAHLTGLHESKVERLLKALTNRTTIEQQSNKVSRLITITNWDEYQDSEQQSNANRTQSRIKNKEERIKNINKGKFHEFMTEEQLGNPEFLEKWNEWVNYRKTEKRNSLTETSAKKQLKILTNATDPIACIDNSLMNGYTGIFDNQKTNNRKTDGQKIREILADF